MIKVTNELRIIDNQKDLFRWLRERLASGMPRVYVTRYWRLVDDSVQRAAGSGFLRSHLHNDWTHLLNSLASAKRSEMMTSLEVQFLVQVLAEMASRGQSGLISLVELNMMMIRTSGLDGSFIIGRDKACASLSMEAWCSAQYDLVVEISLTAVEFNALQPFRLG